MNENPVNNFFSLVFWLLIIVFFLSMLDEFVFIIFIDIISGPQFILILIILIAISLSIAHNEKEARIRRERRKRKKVTRRKK